jgi:hypothetical protein
MSRKDNSRPGLFDKGIAHGRGKATGHLVGILDPEVSAVVDDFHRFTRPESRAAFAGTWLKIVAWRMDRTWPVIYELLSLVKEQEIYKDKETLRIGLCFETFQEFFENVIGKPFSTWAELEETYHFVKDNQPETFEHTCRGQSGALPYDAARETVKERAKDLAADPEVKPLAEHGNQEGENNSRNRDANGKSVPTGSNSATYLVRRLKRDAPDVAKALARGEYKSVRQAAIAAGIVKVPTPLEAVQRAIARLSPEDRAKLAAWMEQQREK